MSSERNQTYFVFSFPLVVWAGRGTLALRASFVGCINKKTLEFVHAGISARLLMREGRTLSASKCPDYMGKLNTSKYVQGDAVVHPMRTVIYSVASGLLPVFWDCTDHLMFINMRSFVLFAMTSSLASQCLISNMHQLMTCHGGLT